MLNRRLGHAIAKTLQPATSQTVTVKLVHGLTVHEATIPCFMTFGQLKETASSLFGLPMQHVRFNFKGRDRQDQDTLAGAGVKNGSKIFIAETGAHRDQRAARHEAERPAASPQPSGRDGMADAAAAPRQQPGWETFGDSEPAGTRAPPPTPVAAKQRPPASDTERSLIAIGAVAAQVDELQARVHSLPGRADARQAAVQLVETLTQKLLLLDGIEVTPESRHSRKEQINRINGLCDRLEQLRTGADSSMQR